MWHSRGAGWARRPAHLLVAALLPVLAAGCGDPPPDDRVPGPELLEENAPELIGTVTLSEDGFDPSRIELETDQGFELTNGAGGSHRIQGRRDEDLIFDTGEMLPGETTVIVVNTEGAVAFADRDDPDLRFEAVVRPPSE